MDVFQDDLLKKLAFLNSKGFVQCFGDVITRECPPKADTHIGRTFEYLLGVQMNNQQKPDYKGIELKSHKSLSGSAITLLANNPHYFFSDKWVIRKTTKLFYPWYESVCGNRELMNNTVKFRKPNSQGLYLDISNDNLRIQICDSKDVPCLEWDIEALEEKLIEKFSEGAFLFCETKKDQKGRELFHLTKVLHVKYGKNNLLESIKNSSIEIDILFKHKKTLRQLSFRSHKRNLINIFDIFNEYDLSEVDFH